MQIKNIIKITVIVGAIFIGAVAKANLYKVTNVPVAAERDSALAAKEAALAEGQVVAFK